jgi:hypothetical protein
MPSSATLQTPSSPQIHNLPLDYFYSATLAPFYSALDNQALSRQLATVQGTFLLSLNDEEFIRRTFSAFKLEEVEIAYSAQVKSGRRYRELFISNY